MTFSIVERNDVKKLFILLKTSSLEGKTGKVIWKHKIGNSLVNTVHPIDKKQVIATSSDGRIVLLKTK